ncbi:MAG: hypothetical protein J5528_00020 [Firmicutes bacterium]|nr:hypothetical protein [Bacillota bacterium]
MTISFTLQDILICLLMVAAIIALIALTVLLKKFLKSAEELTKTLEKANSALDEARVVLKDATAIVEKTKETSDIANLSIRKASRSVANFADVVSANKSKISAFTGLVNAGASLASLFDDNKAKK